LTWYQATRHSFVSRSLKSGASLDEVSAAVGHSSPMVTRAYYDHFVRKTFSPTLRQGIDHLSNSN
jgi:integrase